MMVRRWVVTASLGIALACGPITDEGTPPVAPVVAASAEPAVVAEVAPSPEPVEPVEATPPEPEPEPEPPLDKPWPDELEPKILALQPLVAEAAAEHGVDPHLVNAVIWVESKFDRKAHNRSGARGLMQLMPTTAKAIGRALKRPAKVYDAEFNVHAGTWYLSRMLAKFDGDEALALAAYVRGPAKIKTWIEEDHPFPSSVTAFVDKVQRTQRVFAALGWPEIEPGAERAGSGSGAAAETATPAASE